MILWSHSSERKLEQSEPGGLGGTRQEEGIYEGILHRNNLRNDMISIELQCPSQRALEYPDPLAE
jgi:hypothetical protein